MIALFFREPFNYGYNENAIFSCPHFVTPPIMESRLKLRKGSVCYYVTTVRLTMMECWQTKGNKNVEGKTSFRGLRIGGDKTDKSL